MLQVQAIAMSIRPVVAALMPAISSNRAELKNGSMVTVPLVSFLSISAASTIARLSSIPGGADDVKRKVTLGESEKSSAARTGTVTVALRPITRAAAMPALSSFDFMVFSSHQVPESA